MGATQYTCIIRQTGREKIWNSSDDMKWNVKYATVNLLYCMYLT